MSLKPLTHSLFTEHFGYAPALTIQAPGRVNLIGEHTDYNDGFVLPCAIDYQTVIACAKRNDRQIRVLAADYQHQQDQFSLDDPIVSHPDQRWSDYVRGVVKHLQRRNADFGGADLVIAGNVPQGAGLSSSAALEVAVGQALQALYQLPLDGVALALNGQEAENQFVGCNCGIMDQLISALGRRDSALLIDCRSLETRAVPMPDNVAVVIVNSMCNAGWWTASTTPAANSARKRRGSSASRRGDVSPEQFEARQHQLDPLVAKRARHVISENARTLAAADALAVGDLQRMGRLMAESHASMRDDFEITVPPIDKLVRNRQSGDRPARRRAHDRRRLWRLCRRADACRISWRRCVPPWRTSIRGKPGGLQETFYVCRASQGASAYADRNLGSRPRWATLSADAAAKRRRHDGDADGLGRHLAVRRLAAQIRRKTRVAARLPQPGGPTRVRAPIWAPPSAVTPTASPTPVCSSTGNPCAGRQSGAPPAARRAPTVLCPPLGRVQYDSQQVCYALHSAEGDQAFPAISTCRFCYRLTHDNRLANQLSAQVDRPCPVNLTNHAYFNLMAPATDARAQRLQLFADRYLPVDAEGIPCRRSDAGGRQRHGFSPAENAAAGFSLRDSDQQRVKATITHSCCISTCGRWRARRLICGPPTGKCK